MGEQMREHPQVKKEFDFLLQELRRGDATGLKLRCITCDSKDHLTKDCPKCPIDFEREAKKCNKVTKKHIEAEVQRWANKGQCICGNIFMQDSIYCRKCGRKRDVQNNGVVDKNVSL